MLPAHPLLVDAEPLGPAHRHGNERRTPLRLADGREALLCELVDELAAQASIRRRYHQDIARVAALELDAIAPLLAWGPARAEDLPEHAPWRLRPQIAGESLQAWIDRYAPAPPDLVAAKLAALCTRLAELHTHGLVIRDLTPSKIVEDEPGQLWLLDVGLARTDILSTRTAASLVLEGSPYAAPELLERTAVDARADLYAVGMLGFAALTGQLPFADTHALLRPEGSAPPPSRVCPAVPPELDALIVALLERDPAARPSTATLVAAILRGEAQLPSRALARVSCQSCGAPLPAGQRLCLSCGKLAVRFAHAERELPHAQRYKLVLRKVEESAEFMAALRELCEQLAQGELPPLNFIVGDARMYSEEERKRGIPLPITLFNDLDHDTALALKARFEARGIELKVRRIEAPNDAPKPPALARKQRYALAGVGGGITALVGIATVAGFPIEAALGIMAVLMIVLGALFGTMRKQNRKTFERWGHAMLGLRSTPAALPASDPLVARLAALLDGELAADVRERVAHLALLVQRVVDHRGRNAGSAADIDLAVSELEPLIALIEGRVAAIRTLDRDLAALDEGRLIRALAAADARQDAPAERERYLEGLERLRELEVARASALAKLNRAAELAERSAQLALRVRDEDREREREIQLALAQLA